MLYLIYVNFLLIVLDCHCFQLRLKLCLLCMNHMLLYVHLFKHLLKFSLLHLIRKHEVEYFNDFFCFSCFPASF